MRMAFESTEKGISSIRLTTVVHHIHTTDTLAEHELRFVGIGRCRQHGWGLLSTTDCPMDGGHAHFYALWPLAQAYRTTASFTLVRCMQLQTERRFGLLQATPSLPSIRVDAATRCGWLSTEKEFHNAGVTEFVRLFRTDRYLAWSLRTIANRALSAHGRGCEHRRIPDASVYAQLTRWPSLASG